uniref:T-cell surface glycoprotein CD3 epsilon chain n=1 Tax=Fundulus heteroclitus TaxID=8078 RepID=A0A3Q2QSH9_FUNHE
MAPKLMQRMEQIQFVTISHVNLNIHGKTTTSVKIRQHHIVFTSKEEVSVNISKYIVIYVGYCIYVGNPTAFCFPPVCENCFELTVNFFLVIIMADLFGSVVVMALIYKCSKKKSSVKPSKPTKATPKTGGRAPPVPSPDYESLNVHTLSSDTYSTMNTGMVNRMGKRRVLGPNIY